MPATLAVTGTGDTIAVDGFVTLREAITSVNSGANVNGDIAASSYGTNDTINFNIAGAPGTVHTIQPQSAMPTITKPVNINGYSQLGASTNTLPNGDNAFLAIELDGTNSGFNAGLVITGGGSTIQGLVINRFNNEGILVYGEGGNSIRGNFIGVDATGKLDLGNGVSGVALLSSNNFVGGTSPADRNVISGNDFLGVTVLAAGVTGNLIQGNFIGTDDTGLSALPNAQAGIRILNGTNNLIGGTVPGAGNRIAFNAGPGVQIGINAGEGNAIVGNSIYANAQTGIDLAGDGVTVNDASDADIGPNALQNTPTLTTATSSSGVTTVTGSLQSTPNRSFYVELFASVDADPTGFGEGQTLLGGVAVTTNAAGAATFTFQASTTVAVGMSVTATATEFLLNNTSEFCDAITLGTPEQRFVHALYVDALGRNGDFSGNADAGFWVNQLIGGTQTRAQVANAIERSPEARARLVTSWYQSYLGRTPQASETQFWVNLLLQNQSEAQVQAGILSSNEFYNRAQTLSGSGTTDERFIKALYQLLLARQGSAGEVTGWVNLLPQLGRSGVALSFLGSGEHRTILVSGYYQRLLKRAADSGGLSFWVNSGAAAIDIRIGLESSAEYLAKA